MPEEFKQEDNFNQAVKMYKGTKEAYQPLSSLIHKIKHIWTLNSTSGQNQESTQSQPSIA